LESTDVDVGESGERLSEFLYFFRIGLYFLALFILGAAFLLYMEA
jgi:hypothetical protein